MSREFETVKPGDVIVCYDEYGHDYEEHDFLVESVENTNEEGIVAYGKDLDCPEDEGGDYIGRVSKANFVGFSDTKRCKECLKPLVEGKNHSGDNYEPDLCDACMDEHYGYCDKCGKLFRYHLYMTKQAEGGVLCKDCRKAWMKETGRDSFDDIQFHERTCSDETEDYTYYFTAPDDEILEMFPGKYNSKEVVSTEISIEIPKKNGINDLSGVVVSISPTRATEDGYEDYDWEEIDLPDSQVLRLLERGMREAFSFEEYWESGLIIQDLCIPGACPMCDEIEDCIADTSFITLKSMSEHTDAMAEIMQHARQLYNRTCRGEHTENEKLFKVKISEMLSRTVVIYADCEEEAFEKAEELCNSGTINLTGDDFDTRAVDVKGVADDAERKVYEIYGKDDE